jgi:hypothetical protein
LERPSASRSARERRLVLARNPRGHRARHVRAYLRHAPDARGDAVALRIARIAHAGESVVNTAFR